MSNQFDTSFIPQQPLLRVEGVKGRHEPVNFALVLSLILFFVVLITAGGIYFYAGSIDARIQAREAELASLEETLDSSRIAEYKGIESRITYAKAVLRDHNVFSVVFALLEGGAADNIGLVKLASANRDNKFHITVDGVGPSYQSVYFQLETWRRISPLVLRVDLATMTLEETTGIVQFSVNIALKPEQMRYADVYQVIEKARIEELQPASTATLGTELKPQTP